MTTKPKYIIVVLHDCFGLRNTIAVCKHNHSELLAPLDLVNLLSYEPHGRLTEKQFEVYSK